MVHFQNKKYGSILFSEKGQTGVGGFVKRAQFFLIFFRNPSLITKLWFTRTKICNRRDFTPTAFSANLEKEDKCYWSENDQFLCVSIPHQPVVELNGLNEVFNGDPLIEPMKPFCVIFCDKGWSEPGRCQYHEEELSSFVACRSWTQDVDSASYPCWLWGCQEQYGLQGTPGLFLIWQFHMESTWRAAFAMTWKAMMSLP